MHVEEIMTPSPEYLTTSSTVQQASDLMRGRDIGSIPVVEGGQLVGIVTDRDIVVRGLANNLGPDSTLLEVMTAHVQSVSPESNLRDAYNLMEREQIRRLPVVDGSGSLVGLVSLGDLATRAGDHEKLAEALEVISQPE